MDLMLSWMSAVGCWQLQGEAWIENAESETDQTSFHVDVRRTDDAMSMVRMLLNPTRSF